MRAPERPKRGCFVVNSVTSHLFGEGSLEKYLNQKCVVGATLEAPQIVAIRSLSKSATCGAVALATRREAARAGNKAALLSRQPVTYRRALLSGNPGKPGPPSTPIRRVPTDRDPWPGRQPSAHGSRNRSDRTDHSSGDCSPW